ncbi:MAG: ester cyclase [Chloroflexota bacterium]|nr:ester cyclase [Chloroflexota bacterium]MDQ5867906.1 ester cyclase [Chloroflexota bacterium]
MSLSVEEKKQGIRDLYEKAFNARNLDYLDQVFDASYMDHSTDAPGPMDRDSFKQFVGMYFQAFPDMRFEIEGEIVAEGDYVAWRDVATGTHQGEFMGIPATGKRIRITGVHIGQFDENGYAIAHWSAVDTLGMLQQLGVVPEIGVQPAMA